MAINYNSEKSKEIAFKLANEKGGIEDPSEAAKKVLNARSNKNTDDKKVVSVETEEVLDFVASKINLTAFKKSKKEVKKSYSFSMTPSLKKSLDATAKKLNMSTSEFIENILKEVIGEE